MKNDIPTEPAFARRDDMIELRQKVPAPVLQMFDAVSIARDKDRCDLVIEVMTKAAEIWLHEATVIQRVTRGNPPLSDTSGGLTQ